MPTRGLSFLTQVLFRHQGFITEYLSRSLLGAVRKTVHPRDAPVRGLGGVLLGPLLLDKDPEAQIGNTRASIQTHRI